MIQLEIQDINKILLYIFVILLLFCIMYIFIYSDQKISFDNDYNNKYQDNFGDTSVSTNPVTTQPSYYSESDGQKYYKSLSDFNDYIVKNQNNLINIVDTVTNAQNNTSSNNDKLVDTMTKLYTKEYLEYINKINAVVYNKSNQYLKSNLSKLKKS